MKKPFIVKHKSGEKRWAIEETKIGFISPTSHLMFLEIDAPPA